MLTIFAIRAHGRAPLQFLPSFNKLNDIPIRVLHHRDARPRTDLCFWDSEFDPFILERDTEAAQLFDDESDIANAELFLQADRTSRWHLFRVHQLDITGAESQAVQRTEAGLQFFGLFQTKKTLIEIQTLLDVAHENTEID